MGKSCSRLCYYPFYILVVGLAGTFILLSVMPMLCLGNTLLCLLLALAAPLWAVFLSLLMFLFNILLGDTRGYSIDDAYFYPGRRFMVSGLLSRTNNDFERIVGTEVPTHY